MKPTITCEFKDSFYEGKKVFIKDDRTIFIFRGTITRWDQYGFIVKGRYDTEEEYRAEHEIYFPHSKPITMEIL